jgi:pilus assembly protein FimV
VQRGETLSQIASGVAGAKVNSAHTRSWIVAIYNANPEAFRKNMNVMRSGAVLRIPEASEAAAISAGEASAEIHRQYTAWRGAAPESTPAPAEQPGRLKLVTPSGPAAANVTPVAPPSPAPSAKEAAAAAAASNAAKEAEAKRLLELKNEELARMQAQNAAADPAPAPRRLRQSRRPRRRHRPTGPGACRGAGPA